MTALSRAVTSATPAAIREGLRGRHNDRILRRTQRALSRPLARVAGVEVEDGDAGEQFFLLPGGEAPGGGLVWSAPRGAVFEVHGHSFVLVDADGRRQGEVLVEADGPALLLGHRVNGRAKRVTLRCSARATIRVRTGELLTVERGVALLQSGWQTWDGPRQLTYLLDAPRTAAGKRRLCIVFSAIGAPRDFTYNYRSALEDVDAYRLFILDNFGVQGSYYYADHRDTSIFESVQGLLKDVSESLAIAPQDTTFVGSSKGGAAALMHGLHFGAGSIIAGAPQCFPGKYLKAVSPTILRFIAGDVSDEAVEWLDCLLPDALAMRKGEPRVTILVGQNDGHRRIHVLPFLKMASAAALDANAVIVQDLSHQEIGRAFGPFTRALLEGAAPDRVIPYRLQRKIKAPSEVRLRLWVPPGEEASVTFMTPEGPPSSSRSTGEREFGTVVSPDIPVWATIRRTRASTGQFICEFDTPVLAPTTP